MSKRKHFGKRSAEVCTDANQNVKKHIAEKERIRLAAIERQRKLAEAYENELKKRSGANDEKQAPQIVDVRPKEDDTPIARKTVANDISGIKSINALKPEEE